MHHQNVSRSDPSCHCQNQGKKKALRRSTFQDNAVAGEILVTVHVYHVKNLAMASPSPQSEVKFESLMDQQCIILSSSDLFDQNAVLTWLLIFWDYLITLDNEVCPYTSSHVGLSTDQLKDYFVLGASSFWHGPISVWHLKIGWAVLRKTVDQILILCRVHLENVPGCTVFISSMRNMQLSQKELMMPMLWVLNQAWFYM
ncbi:hypothetical protein ARMGADRAFT_1034977 [Armillaria gallica]|uniref:Uncharacterized protein n=1 Tax=Armillaria gallica TaxID=47427 RepID=A0A2H3CVL3_ARMGA|nr:hypothetical protein ARMGADRAFT_1034977 [Armillaria gallica]